jgi:hypothetical protein
MYGKIDMKAMGSHIRHNAMMNNCLLGKEGARLFFGAPRLGVRRDTVVPYPFFTVMLSVWAMGETDRRQLCGGGKGAA